MIEIEFNGKLNNELTLNSFKSTVPQNVITYLNKIYSNKNAKLVYTSFNGDYIGCIDNMVYDAVRSGYVPINSEFALGYYLSTVSFNNSKIETMLACISLVLLCDEFWIYIDDQDDIYDLPEGVIAEIYAWSKFKDCKSKVKIRENKRYVNILNGITTIHKEKVESINKLKPVVNQIEVSQLLCGLDKYVINDIENRLISRVERYKMRCRYISFDFRDEKYKDWARKYCYNTSSVALIANTLINPFIIDLVTDAEYYDKYLFLRTQILKKCDDIVFFFKPSDLENDHLYLTIDVINDLYFCLINGIKFVIKSWKDIKVPKYCNRDWAITDKEREENI